MKCDYKKKSEKKETPLHNPGGYKYRDLSLHVGGVSSETVKYGHEFCGFGSESDCSGKA
jgi:hypothetical protein